MSGTYRFKTGFCVVKDMPAESQNAIDTTLTELTNTYCFLDDTLIVSCRILEKHMTLVRKCPKKLDKINNKEWLV